MTELADVTAEPAPGVTFRRARVISVSGHSLTVDMGGGIQVQALDHVYPVPDQWVLLAVDGQGMTAVGAISGVVRQATLTVTSTNATTATGLLNGVSAAVVKMGSFTPSVGNVLPLVWSADGSRVWVGGPEGAATVAPPAGGGASGGSGAIGASTATYSASSSGTIMPSGGTVAGQLALGTSRTGFFAFGVSRMNELQGRTLVAGRINLSRISGAGTVSLTASKGGATTAQTVTPGGWVALSAGVLSRLVNGTGATFVYLTGSGSLAGIPAGAVQIDWRL